MRTKAEVMNPVLALPAAKRVATMPYTARVWLVSFLMDLRADAQVRAENSWKRHKSPMAVYWRCIGTYCGHLVRVLRPKPEDVVHLYYIHADDADMNYDLFTRAANETEARGQWVAHFDLGEDYAKECLEGIWLIPDAPARGPILWEGMSKTTYYKEMA